MNLSPGAPRRARPAAVLRGQWTLPALQEHLQYAIDVELFTIPYYMAAMFSIKDPGTEAMQLIRTVVNQEMLHLQLAANLANAFGCAVEITPPVYGAGVPHLDFDLNHPDPTKVFTPWSSEIGPFDVTRLNTMCLIEYPDWHGTTNVDPDATTYRSIGDFYHAVAIGAEELQRHIIGNRNQLSVFKNFYPGFSQPTVTRDGEYGLGQVQDIINAILAQGEGRLGGTKQEHRGRVRPWLKIFGGYVPEAFQNQADDLRQKADHFEKFVYLKGQPLPETWAAGPLTEAGRQAQARLLGNFAALCQILQDEFRGLPGEFSPIMFQVGGDIVSCWRNGATPLFSQT
jgi:hypothetical protein